MRFVIARRNQAAATQACTNCQVSPSWARLDATYCGS
jgi:hypothetical protein